MNSRRLIAPPRPGESHRSGSNWEVGSGQVGARQCPLWVKSRHRSASASCPLYPQKRTWISRAVMSALCQKRTHAVQQKTANPVGDQDGIQTDIKGIRAALERVERGRDILGSPDFWRGDF